MSASKRYGIFEIRMATSGGIDSLSFFTSEIEERNKIISVLEQKYQLKDKNINDTGALINFSKGGFFKNHVSPQANLEVIITLLNNGWEPYFRMREQTESGLTLDYNTFKKQFE